MNEAGPKLYTNKPKKVQLKQFQEQKGKDLSSPTTPTSTPSGSSAAAESYRMGSHSTAPPPPPPPQPPKESFARRYKFLWPLFMTVNLVVVAYLFIRTTNKKDTGLEEEEAASTSSVPSSTAISSTPTNTTTVSEKPVSEPVKPREPIPEQQQHELFKWMLEEKRKVKPKDPEEKKRLDEEKAILKQFIRAKPLPSF